VSAGVDSDSCHAGGGTRTPVASDVMARYRSGRSCGSATSGRLRWGLFPSRKHGLRRRGGRVTARTEWRAELRHNCCAVVREITTSRYGRCWSTPRETTRLDGGEINSSSSISSPIATNALRRSCGPVAAQSSADRECAVNTCSSGARRRGTRPVKSPHHAAETSDRFVALLRRGRLTTVAMDSVKSCSMPAPRID